MNDTFSPKKKKKKKHGETRVFFFFFLEKKYGCVLDEKIVYKDRSGEERNNIREEIGMVH